jgi:hypothetical protein
MKEIEGLELEVAGILRRIHNSPELFSTRDNMRLNEIGLRVREMNDRLKEFGDSCPRLEIIAKALDPQNFNAKILPWDILNMTFQGIDKRIPRKPKPDPLDEMWKGEE